MNFLAMIANKMMSKLEDKFQNSILGGGEGPTHSPGSTPVQAPQPAQIAASAPETPTMSASPMPTNVMNQPTDISFNAGSADEAKAHANGFKSYEEMLAWARQRTQQREPQTIAGAGRPGAPASSGPMDPRNAMAMHPKTIFNYIGDRWREATGGQ